MNLDIFVIIQEDDNVKVIIHLNGNINVSSRRIKKVTVINLDDNNFLFS
jgi:hypothetical protein